MKAEPEADHEARLAAERLGLPFLLYRDGEGRQRRRRRGAMATVASVVFILARMKMGAGRGTARRIYAVTIFSPGWSYQPRLKIYLQYRVQLPPGSKDHFRQADRFARVGHL